MGSYTRIVSLLYALYFITCTLGWTHKEQDKWPVKFCKKGIAQSPIDIRDDANVVERTAKPFKLKNFDVEQNGTLRNEGYWAVIKFDDKKLMTASGGGFPGVYILEQINFQWPAQHTLNGERNALEVHFVFYNSAFESFDEAGDYMYGWAISGALYKEDERDNPTLKPIVDKLESIKKAESSIDLKLDPSTLLPEDLTKFFRYTGSSTIPDCKEGVMWTITQGILKVSKKQMDKFKALKGKDGNAISKGNRDIQKLNSRTIYKLKLS